MGIQLILLFVINALNLASVKVYGEAEFWFSIIKVVAIIAMILFGSYLLINGTGGENASVSNLWNNGGFFPKGWISTSPDGSFQGLLAAMALIMFSFGGLELVGITAAEAENPEKYPKSHQSGNLQNSYFLCRCIDHIIFIIALGFYY